MSEENREQDHERAQMIAQLSLEGQTVSKGGRRRKETDQDQ